MEPLCRLLQTWDGVWNGAGRWLLHCGDAAGLFFVSPSLFFVPSFSPPMLLLLPCRRYGSFSYRHHPKQAEPLLHLVYLRPTRFRFERSSFLPPTSSAAERAYP